MVRPSGPAPTLSDQTAPTRLPLRFQVLGPLTITSDGAAVVLQPSKPTALLAALLVNANDVVPVATLQRAIWGDVQPHSAKAALHTCAMRLRQLFARHGGAETAIETVPGGYRIVAAGDTVDLVRFRDVVRRARTTGDPETELALLEQGLSLWHGPVLANVSSEILHRDVVPGIAEERLRAVERVADLRIGLGRPRAALADLWQVVRAHPGHERFSAQLVEALYRTGRQADALAEIRRIRGYLGTELGVDPGPDLIRLELAILRGEPPAGTVAPPATVHPAPPLPRPPGFVGRDAATREVAERLRGGTTVTVLSGLPGAGKTALALHVAASVTDAFPGGQMLIPLTGPDGNPRPGAEVAAQAEPVTAGGKRALLVLDAAADVDHARAVLAALPLPAGDLSVLLTSRTSLAGVIARYGGWPHRLGPLEPEESLLLLANVLGRDRTAAEPEAARHLTLLCAHLPLALRVLGTRLLTKPDMRLADAVTWLDEDPIARLTLTGDPDLSVSGRFDAAMGTLDAGTRAALVRLGASGALETSLEAAAALLGLPQDAAETTLDRLVDAGLLDESLFTYRMNGLLRRYAASATGTFPPQSPDPKGTRA